MCRIAYIPEPKKIRHADLCDLFQFLDRRAGGDGMGVAIIRDGKIEMVKGVKADKSYLADFAKASQGPALFHTRRATSGAVCDYLCQPFVMDGTAFVHNGIWSGWEETAINIIVSGKLDADYPINDTITAAAMAIRFGRYSLEALKSGVFVVMGPDVTYLHLRRGDFAWSGTLGIYASEFPHGIGSQELQNDSIAVLGSDGPHFENGGFCKGGKVWIYQGGHGAYQYSYPAGKVTTPSSKAVKKGKKEDAQPAAPKEASAPKTAMITVEEVKDTEQKYLGEETPAKLRVSIESDNPFDDVPLDDLLEIDPEILDADDRRLYYEATGRAIEERYGLDPEIASYVVHGEDDDDGAVSLDDLSDEELEALYNEYGPNGLVQKYLTS